MTRPCPVPPSPYAPTSLRSLARRRPPLSGGRAGPVVRDVTEWDPADAHAELARQRAYFEQILNSVEGGLAVFDADGRHEYVSPKATPDDELRRWMIGKSQEEYAEHRGLPPEVTGPRYRAIEAVRATRTPVEFEQTIQTKDGSTRYMLRRLVPILDDAGDVVRMLTYSVDITERVESARVLRFQKTLLEAEGEASIDGILVVSPEGHILSHNTRFVQMWGLAAEAVVSRSDEGPLETVAHRVADPEPFLARVQHLGTHPDEVARDEVSLRDGHVFDCYSAPVQSREGDYYGRIWFFRDVTPERRHASELETARKEAERAYQKADEHAQQLERSIAELQRAQEQLVHQEKMAGLGRLTAGIAHEIKNPLNFVTNFAKASVELVEELREELADADADGAGAILDDLTTMAAKIVEHGDRADRIVKGMLQHSTGGRVAFDEVRVNAFVDDYVNLAFHGMRAHDSALNVEIVRDYDDGAGSVEAVPQEFGRVLVNLLNNAFYAVREQARRQEGAAAPRIRVATRRRDGEVEIRVEDNGPGVPEAIRQRLFEPFFTTKPPGEGTGLGLSLSYDIVTKVHGGRLELEMAEGRGTTFVVTLPIRPASGTAPRRASTDSDTS